MSGKKLAVQRSKVRRWGSFRPQATLTRTEFAVLMLNSFGNVEPTRSAPTFRDVPSSFWGHRAIRDTYAREFFSGYPDGTFRPTEAIPRVHAIARYLRVLLKWEGLIAFRRG